VIPAIRQKSTVKPTLRLCLDAVEYHHVMCYCDRGLVIGYVANAALRHSCHNAIR